LTLLGNGLGVRSDPSDNNAERRTIDDSESVTFTLSPTATLGDATSVSLDLGKVGGSGQVALQFWDDGILVDSVMLSPVGNAISYSLAGIDFDMVSVAATGGLSFEIDEITFDRATVAPPPPPPGIETILDFSDGGGSKHQVTYIENGTTVSVINQPFVTGSINIGAAGAVLTAQDPSGRADLSLLGSGLGVRTYSTDDASVFRERRTIDDAETIALQLNDTATVGDAFSIEFDFAKVTGTGSLVLDFWDDGVLVDQATLQVLGSNVFYDLPGLVDFDLVEFGVTGDLALDIDSITLFRDDLLA
jgi:hypothetical protein